MKKISLILIIAIVMSIFTYSAGAENTLVFKFAFSQGQEFGSTSYSDPPDSGVDPSEHTQFTYSGGKLIYDTAPQIAAGTAYPYRNTTTPSYPRASYGGTINNATDGKYLYETEIRFERSFFRIDFVARYGAGGWENGVTNDVNLYNTTDSGYLSFGSQGMQLELGKTYKTAVLTDLTDSTSYKKHLYIDGVLRFSNEVTQIGHGGGTPARVFSVSHILRPYRTASPYAYVDTKITIGDFAITKITDEYILSGDDTVYIMPDESSDYQYNFSDMFSIARTPIWSVSPAGAGVSISDTGLLTVEAGAAEGDYEITAEYSGITKTKTISAEEFVYIYTISGNSDIVIVAGEGTKQYTYECSDQNLTAKACSYSILEAGSGLTITSDGILSVPESVTNGSYTIIAKDGDIEISRFTVNIMHLSYSITGNSRIYTPQDGSLAMVQYKLVDNLGASYPDAVFRQAGAAVTGVTVEPDGRVYFDGTVTASGIQITATRGTNTLTKSIELVRGRFINFESDTVGSMAEGWDSRGPAVVDTLDGNKFLNAMSGTMGRMYISNMGYSQTTLKFKTMMRTSNGATANILDLGACTRVNADQSIDNGAWYLPMQASKNGSNNVIRMYGTDRETVQIDRWTEIELVFDYDKSILDLYINGQLKTSDYPLPSGDSNYRLEGLFVSCATDDISIYSGIAVSRDIIIKTAENVFLPEAGSVRETILKADVSYDGTVIKNAAVEWSMPVAHAGVTLTGDVLTVSENASGSFQVTAKIPGTDILDTKTFNLIVPDVYPSITGSQLFVTASPNTVINISIFPTINTQTLMECFGTEFSGTALVTTTITTDSNGRGSYSLASLLAGRYDVHAFKTGSPALNLEYVSKPEALLSDADAMGDEAFKELLKEFSNMSDEDIEASFDIYTDVSGREMVKTLANGDFDSFYLAVLLTVIKEQTVSNAELNAKAAAELTKVSGGVVSKSAIELLSNVTNYGAVIVSVENAAGIADYMNRLFEAEVLYEIKNCANVRDPKVFVAAMNNTKYDNATESQKNYICEQLANNTYAGLSAVHTAINSLILPSDTPLGGTGGGGGGGGSYGGTTSGTIGLDYMQTPVEPSKNAYSDVAPDHWAYTYIEKMFAWGIMSGFEGNFRPNDRITRAELLKTLVESFNITGDENCDFIDISSSDWYAKYVGIAYNNGLVTGYDGEFHPNDFVTRQDALVMIYRFGVHIGMSFTEAELSYSDAADISDYAITAMSAAAGTKIIGGYEDNTVKPLGSLTRAETTKIIYESLTIGGIRNA